MVKFILIIRNLNFSLLRTTFNSKFRNTITSQEKGQKERKKFYHLLYHSVPAVWTGNPHFLFTLGPTECSQDHFYFSFLYHGSLKSVCGSEKSLCDRLLCVNPQNARLHYIADYSSPQEGSLCIFHPPWRETPSQGVLAV